MGFGWFFGLLNMLLVLALLGLLLYLGLRAWERGSGEPRKDAALEALRLRYARGELDEETYRRLRKELEQGGEA
jgi:putative membrane protein